MKLDTSGFETSMPTIGFGSSNDMLDGFSIVPSFDLPSTTDVSFINFDEILLDTSSVAMWGDLFVLGFSLMGYRKKLSWSLLILVLS